MPVLVGEKIVNGKNDTDNNDNNNNDDDNDVNDDGTNKIQHELMEWHPVSGLLALTTYHSSIEAIKSDRLPIRKTNARVTYLCWHPVIDIIATNWDSGDVIFRFVQNDKDFSLPNENISNDNEIKCMLWSMNELKICIIKKEMIKIVVNGMINEEANCICRWMLERKSFEHKNVNQVNVEPNDKLKTMSTSHQPVQSSSTSTTTIDERIKLIEYFIIGGINGGIYTFHHNGEIREIYRIKLNGKWPNFQIIMMGVDMLATCNGENEIRIWDLKNDENGAVSLRSTKGFSATDTITCLSYSNVKDCLSGGTANGKIANWRHFPTADGNIDKQWILQEAVNIGSKIKMIKWSTVSSILAVSTGIAITLLKEQAIFSHMNGNVNSGIAIRFKKVTLIRLEPFEQYDIQISIHLKGLHMGEKYLAIWDDQQIHLYEIINESNEKLKIQLVANFNCSTISVAVYQQNVHCIEDDKIKIRTFQGTVKQVISIPEMEGNPIMIDINDCWMCVVHPGIMVWDADSDVVSNFNFITGMTDQQQYEADANTTNIANNRPNTAVVRKIEKEQIRYRLPDYLPGFHCWDSNDSRYLICEANHRKPNTGPNYFLSIFVTSEDGLYMEDLHLQSRNWEILLGCTIPYIYSVRKDNDEADNRNNEMNIGSLVLRQVLREFIGLENSDTTTKEAMMNFSYYMTVNKMDEAFKAIKFIKSENAWEHMAHMCVKTRRLDVALVCLGNMGHARGVRALRKSMQNNDPLEVQDEAQELLTNCKRYDMVNRLLQTRNRWDEAFKIAEKYDRLHLRNTYYNYANYLESLNSIDAAIENYEKSDTHRFEVPRMLFDRPKMLEAYVKKTKDPGVQKWWAQYMESQGDVKAARLYYQYAKDYLSVIRLLCRSNNIDEAVEIANSSGDKAACYHLGRYFETHGDSNMAVTFLQKHMHAENNMTDKVANLALMAGGNELVEAAQYYENIPGHADKAVMLYHKHFSAEQFSALDLITNELDENSDLQVLKRAAEFFTINQQYNKAVQLLIYSKQYSEAINLCKQKNVPINETLAEALTPSKDDVSDEADRIKLLELIAECCVQQRNYHFAAKKYTQAAANYLQTLNWKDDCDLMKQIELFYNKANAYEHLASFYEACAQIEIDDYHDYNKAVDALNESLRCIAKALQCNPKNDEYLTSKQVELHQAIGNITEFIQIRTVYELDSINAIRQLEAFADDKQICKNIRLGDIYAIMIAYNVQKANYRKAYALIQKLKENEPNIDLNCYINKEMQDTICNELQLPDFTNDKKNESEFDQDQQRFNDDEEVDYSYALKRNIQRQSKMFDEKDFE
ncbi:hypothetical protein DINM_007106 [Dirofilaria immitis]|nr:hypothetical protein [Dirofilaria immitis]